MRILLGLITAIFIPLSVFAAPAKPFIAWTPEPTSGNFTLTWNMWWGENGTTAKLEENGVIVDTKTLSSASPQAQTGNFTLKDRTPGTYQYRVLLCK